MGDRGLRVRELFGGVCITVESEETARGKRRRCEFEVQILASGIAVDFDGNTQTCCRDKDSVPIGDDARARSGNAAAWMGKNSDDWVPNRGDESFCLIFCAAKA